MSGAVSCQNRSSTFTDGIVIHAHDQLQDAHELRAAERPAIAKHLVVHVLNSNSGELPENIQRIENFLKVDERDFERQALALDLNLQCGGCVAMPAAGIKEDKRDASLTRLAGRAFRLPSIVAASLRC